MAFAFIRRTARGTGFHTPDKDHVHHRLLRLGHGPRRTVAILWAWTAVLSAFLLLPLFDKRANAVILFGVIVLGLALYTLFHPGLRKDTMNGSGVREHTPGGDGTEHELACAESGSSTGDGADDNGIGSFDADASLGASDGAHASLVVEVPSVGGHASGRL